MDTNYPRLRRTITNFGVQEQAGNTFYIGERRVSFNEKNIPIQHIAYSQGPLQQPSVTNLNRSQIGSRNISKTDEQMYEWQAYDPASPLEEEESVSTRGTGRSRDYEADTSYAKFGVSEYRGGMIPDGSLRNNSGLDPYNLNCARSAWMAPTESELAPNTFDLFPSRVRISLDDAPSVAQPSQSRDISYTGFRNKSFDHANPPDSNLVDKSGRHVDSMHRTGINPSPPRRPDVGEGGRRLEFEEMVKQQSFQKNEFEKILLFQDKSRSYNSDMFEESLKIASNHTPETLSEKHRYKSAKSFVVKRLGEKDSAVPAESDSYKIIGYESGIPRAMFRRKVTHVDGDIGFAGTDLFFQMRTVKGEILPWVGCTVFVLAEKVASLPFEWSAISVEVDVEAHRNFGEARKNATEVLPITPLAPSKPLKSILKSKPPPPPIISKPRRNPSPDEPAVIFESSLHRFPSLKVSSTSSRIRKSRRSPARSAESAARRKDCSPKLMSSSSDKSTDRVSRNQEKRRFRSPSLSRSPLYVIDSHRSVDSRSDSMRERSPRSQSCRSTRRRNRRSRSSSSSGSRRKTRRYSRSTSKTPPGARTRRRTQSRSRSTSPFKRQMCSRSRSPPQPRKRISPINEETFVTTPAVKKGRILEGKTQKEKLQAKVAPIKFSVAKPPNDVSLAQKGLRKLPFIGKRPKPKPKTQAPAYKLVEHKAKAFDAASEAKKATLTAEVLKQARERIAKAKLNLQAALERNVVEHSSSSVSVCPTLPNPLFTPTQGNPQTVSYTSKSASHVQPVQYNDPLVYDPHCTMSYNLTNQYIAVAPYPANQQQYSYGTERNFHQDPHSRTPYDSMNQYTQRSCPQKILRTTLGAPNSKSFIPYNSCSNLLANPLHKLAKGSEPLPPGTEKSMEKSESSSTGTVLKKKVLRAVTHTKPLQVDKSVKELISNTLNEMQQNREDLNQGTQAEIMNLRIETHKNTGKNNEQKNVSEGSENANCTIFIKSGASIFEDHEELLPIECKKKMKEPEAVKSSVSVSNLELVDTDFRVIEEAMDPAVAVSLGCHLEQADLARTWMVCTRCANDGHLINMCDKERIRRALPFDIAEAKIRLSARMKQIQMRKRGAMPNHCILEEKPDEPKKDLQSISFCGSDKPVTSLTGTSGIINAEKKIGNKLGDAGDCTQPGTSSATLKPSEVSGRRMAKTAKLLSKSSGFESRKLTANRNSAKKSFAQRPKVPKRLNSRGSTVRRTVLCADKMSGHSSIVDAPRFENEPLIRISRRRSNSPQRVPMITDDPMTEVAVKQLQIKSLELRELEIQQEMKLLKVIRARPLEDHSPPRSPLPRVISPLDADSFCYACLSRGHKGRYCKIPWPSWLVNRKRTKDGYVVLKREKREPFCLACGESGHFTRNCSLKDPGKFYSDDE